MYILLQGINALYSGMISIIKSEAKLQAHVVARTLCTGDDTLLTGHGHMKFTANLDRNVKLLKLVGLMCIPVYIIKK